MPIVDGAGSAGQKLIPEEKHCSKCDTVRPLADFHSQVDGKFGRRSHCMICVAEAITPGSKARKAKRAAELAMGLKTCANCGERKPATVEFFPTDEGASDGWDSWCRACKNRSARAWQVENAEQAKASSHRNRARRKNAPGRGFTGEQWRLMCLVWGGCAYCGLVLPAADLEVEHVVPICDGGADDVLNVLPACGNCNRGLGGKFSRDPLGWMASRGVDAVHVLRRLAHVAETLEGIYPQKTRGRLPAPGSYLAAGI